jgi:hypothetical protein
VTRRPRHDVQHRRYRNVDSRFATVFLCLLLAVPQMLIAGQEHAATTTPFSPGPPGKFVDITGRSGVNFRYQASHTSKKYLPETMGAGVALFDYDNDGRLDIFLVNGAPLGDPEHSSRIGTNSSRSAHNQLAPGSNPGTPTNQSLVALQQSVDFLRMP